MPTLDWLNRDEAFRIAERVPTRVLRRHAAGHEVGNATDASGLGLARQIDRALR